MRMLRWMGGNTLKDRNSENILGKLRVTLIQDGLIYTFKDRKKHENIQVKLGIAQLEDKM